MTHVTISDIAATLGISTAAVSYALNGRPGVSAATRQRVLDLVEEMAWKPDSTARSLRSRRSMAVGIALSRDPEEIAYEPFYSYIQAGIEQALAARGYSLMISRPGRRPGAELDVYRTWAAQRRVDGVILFDLLADDPRRGVLPELRLPFVEVTSEDAGPAPRVLVDDAADAANLVRHLADQGYRSLVHLSGPVELTHERLRADAIARTAAAFGLDVIHGVCRYTMEDGIRGFLEAFEEVGKGPTAAAGAPGRPLGVIASSDLLALGALRGAQRLELGVPNQVGVVSWDDSLPCRISNPPLTSLERRPIEMGRLAADLLLDRLDGRHRDLVRLPPSELTVRASSRRDASSGSHDAEGLLTSV
ncbi:LacI family DNA-binding transcriptional regulator [Acidipropionibacterium acidipropionici]|uniref:LacI family DNA-binding transcriptional regulator n=1 Tax=Acidipropionibacterium acidipropionici TaxID=1748 RepID=UPI0015865119|nr:LacI family DNA-binding transcriptional regulator [Acidipropionibacterium acidipropionici]